MKKDIIAVIGGIASGKSTVLSILERDFSYRILGMDEIAKALYGEETVLQELKKLLPKEVFTEENFLFRNFASSFLLSRRERRCWKTIFILWYSKGFLKK